MYTLIIILHIITCLFMIGAILLQSGKGAEIGAAFGGSSQTVFGSRGPANFLSKLTIVFASIFMITSLTLAIMAKERTFSSTVIDLNKKDSSTTTTAPAVDQKPAASTPAPTSAEPAPSGK